MRLEERDLGTGYMLCYMATVDEYGGGCMEYRNGSGHEFCYTVACLLVWDLRSSRCLYGIVWGKNEILLDSCYRVGGDFVRNSEGCLNICIVSVVQIYLLVRTSLFCLVIVVLGYENCTS